MSMDSYFLASKCEGAPSSLSFSLDQQFPSQGFPIIHLQSKMSSDIHSPTTNILPCVSGRQDSYHPTIILLDVCSKRPLGWGFQPNPVDRCLCDQRLGEASWGCHYLQYGDKIKFHHVSDLVVLWTHSILEHLLDTSPQRCMCCMNAACQSFAGFWIDVEKEK